MTKQEVGRSGEVSIRILLLSYKRKVKTLGYGHPFDLIVDGLHVEIKTANLQSLNGSEVLKGWHFNIHRHGKVPESQPDLYLFRLENVPFSSAAIHLVRRGPIGVKSVTMSVRSLLNQNFHEEKVLWEKLCRGQVRD